MGRLPMSSRVPWTLIEWKFMGRAMALAMPCLLDMLTWSAQRPGVLVDYPVGLVIWKRYFVPLFVGSTRRLAIVLFVVLSSARLIDPMCGAALILMRSRVLSQLVLSAGATCMLPRRVPLWIASAMLWVTFEKC